MRIEDAERALGVPAAGGARELRDAYRRAAFRTHPDREGGDAAAFRTVRQAYRALAAVAKPDEPGVARTLDGVMRERAAPIAGSHTPPGAGDEDDGLGEWLRRQVPQGARPPESVPFERFHETFASLARAGAGALVPTKVRELPMACGIGCSSVSPGREGRRREFSGGGSEGGGRSLKYADLRTAYGGA